MPRPSVSRPGESTLPRVPRTYGTVRVGANVGNIGGPLLGAAAVTASLPSVLAVVAAVLGAAVVVISLTVPPDRNFAERP